MRHYVKGGIQRVAPGVWAPISDAQHRYEGIKTVELVPGPLPRVLKITFDFEAQYVVKGICGPDETLARTTIIPGPSMGTSDAIIKFGKLGAQIDPETITNAQANFWVDFELGTDDPV